MQTKLLINPSLNNSNNLNMPMMSSKSLQFKNILLNLVYNFFENRIKCIINGEKHGEEEIIWLGQKEDERNCNMWKLGCLFFIWWHFTLRQ